MTERVHYLHLRNESAAPYNGITLAYHIRDFDPDDLAIVDVAAAYCSPDDNFCKREGRDIALARLQSEEGYLDHRSRLLMTNMREPTTAAEWRAFDQQVIDIFFYDQEHMFDDIPS